MRDLIAEAIDLVVFLIRDPNIGPKLAELVAVEGVTDGQYVFRDMRKGAKVEQMEHIKLSKVG